MDGTEIRDYTEIRDDRIRSKICTLMSEMLDNPTSKFMWEMETFIIDESETLKRDVNKALEELGVPTGAYPAPVANAVGILNMALGLKNGLPAPKTRNYGAMIVDHSDKELRLENKRLETELKQHRWIPVSERLPEDDSPHLFLLESGNVFQGIPSCELGKHNPPLTHKTTHWKLIILPK